MYISRGMFHIQIAQISRSDKLTISSKTLQHRVNTYALATTTNRTRKTNSVCAHDSKFFF